MVDSNCLREMSFGRTCKFVNFSGNCAAAGTAQNMIPSSAMRCKSSCNMVIGILHEPHEVNTFHTVSRSVRWVESSSTTENGLEPMSIRTGACEG